VIRLVRLLILALLLVTQTVPSVGAQSGGREVMVAEVEGVIDSVVARYVRRSIEEADSRGFEALVIRLDTPGGLDTSMREIIQAILASPVPVIVYVAPQGGRAASAGVFIAYAAHVSAMAPGTNIGAASPVALSPEGGTEGDQTLLRKATNDAVAYIQSLAALRGRNAEWAEQAVREAASVPAREAVELGVVDLVAGSVDELLANIDGRSVELETRSQVLHTSEAALERFDMTPFDGFVHKLADPNIAFILFSLGMTAITVELFNPGLILPGVAGVIMIVVALFAFGTLPIEPVGIALIVFAAFLFLLETQVASQGILAVGGVIALILGGIFLFQPIGGDAPDIIRPVIEVSRIVLGSIGGLLLAGLILFLYLARFGRPRTYASPVSQQSLVGQRVQVSKRLDPAGEVHAAGEFWTARLPEGQTAEERSMVVVKGLDGITLLVEVPEGVSRGT
jgi:membrane-bound serine protease (ClpP class)